MSEWQHPSLPRLVASFDDAEHLYIVLPFYEHGTLRTWIDKMQPGQLPEMRWPDVERIQSVARCAVAARRRFGPEGPFVSSAFEPLPVAFQRI